MTRLALGAKCGALGASGLTGPVGDANAPRKTVFLLDEAGDRRLPSVTSLDLRIAEMLTRHGLSADTAETDPPLPLDG